MVWGKQKKKMCWWMLCQEYLTIVKNHLNTNWDEKHNIHRVIDQVMSGPKLALYPAQLIMVGMWRKSEEPGNLQIWSTWWSAVCAVCTRKMLHISILHPSNYVFKDLFGVERTHHTEGVSKKSHGNMNLRSYSPLTSAATESQRLDGRQNGDAASAVSRNSLETQGAGKI